MRRQVLAPYSHFDIPVIGQAYLLFRARLMAPHTHGPGVESLETALFLPEDIPFDQVSRLLVQCRCLWADFMLLHAFKWALAWGKRKTYDMNKQANVVVVRGI